MIIFISVILCNNKKGGNLGRRSKVLSLSVSPEIARELDNIARTEDKSRSEIFKDMFRTYKESVAERQWRELFSFGKETAKKFNIKDEEELFRILDKERS
jgi:metal-responsive CopG/Arc/MetJ family transcriptional regulator